MVVVFATSEPRQLANIIGKIQSELYQFILKVHELILNRKWIM